MATQIRAPQLARREHERMLLHKMYSQIPVGVEVDYSRSTLMQPTDEFEASTDSKANDALRTFSDAGIVTKQVAYVTIDGLPGKPPFPTGPKHVRQWKYTLVMNPEEGERAFDEFWAQQVAAQTRKPKGKSNGHTEPTTQEREAMAAAQTQAARSGFGIRSPQTPAAPADPPRQNERPVAQYGSAPKDARAALAEYEARRRAGEQPEVTPEVRAGHKRAELERIADLQEAAIQRSEAEPVALADDEVEEVRAIAGPEPAKPFDALKAIRKTDDPEAAIAAARAYLNRTKPIDELVKQFRAQGIPVDREKMLAAVDWQRDEFLETISLILPYVDRLESALNIAANAAADLRRKYADYDQLRREHTRLTEANKRVVSENTALRLQLERTPAPKRDA